jgi:DNA processing protein
VTRRAVAVVGARACTEYGEQVTRELAVGCADRGITVVSGAAFGIDAAAHAGALAAGGATVAVLASGVDRPYPRGNVPLIERIVAEGLLVSEVPPGSSPTRNRFVSRNRVIAALAGATVVVEAGWRSGATITAGVAADLGRSVGAVPGPVTSPASVGCHRLLRDGVTCVTSPGEVAELVDPFDAAAGQQLELPARPYDDLSPVDLRVYDALPLGRGAPLPSIAAVAGLDTPAVLASLGRLDLLGLAARNGEAWRRSPLGAA